MYLKLIAKEFVSRMRICKWRAFRKRNLSDQSWVAHLLLVINKDYVRFARICILSFLFHNRNSKLVVHCDEETYELAKRLLSREIKGNLVTLLLDYSSGDSWQFSKVDLISRLSANNEFYMDADLRFNAELPVPRPITFFAREGNMWNWQDFAPFLEARPEILGKEPCYMWNTSFAFMGSNQVSQKEIRERFRIFEKSLIDIRESSNINLDQFNSIWRLREQIFLSQYFENTESEIYALKDKESRLDGGFVESAYFGATGLGF